MKNWIVKTSALFAVLALLAVGTRAYAAGAQDFTLHNETGLEINEVYVSAHNVNDWEEDVLGDDTLSTGKEVEITFSPKEVAESWDLKVVTDTGKSYIWRKLKLMDITDVTIYLKDGKAFARSKKVE
ncbi:MAG TPA: hypothetical protein VGB45_07740 [Abditibacterium sp.]|jgi:hypothetical protein